VSDHRFCDLSAFGASWLPVNRVAMFIDAGYLFKAGSTLLSGREDLTRSQTPLDIAAAAEFFKEFGERVSDLPLLRIYWYDATRGEPSSVHEQLAYSNNIKVRLGIIKNDRQKGVDSLLVTDMISLARNNAMSAAVLLAGDEDTRVGVQQAQEFGVRVHLVGIEPRRTNQSAFLQQEADTCDEWKRDDLVRFLSVAMLPRTVEVAGDAALPLVARIASSVFAQFDEPKRAQLRLQLGQGQLEALPPEINGQLVRTYAQELGRDLSFDEKKEIRDSFRQQVRASVSTGGGS
jgi:uncharacterized LabA/DUF88 family protein